MACHAGMLLTLMLPKMRPLTKWSHVVCRNSRSMSSTTSNKVWQIIGQTLVCVSIHLECWLNKARVEIVTCAAVSAACQQQFSYNLVLKFGSVNTIDVNSIHIPCALGECEFNSHSNRIKCEKALNQLKNQFECTTGYN